MAKKRLSKLIKSQNAHDRLKRKYQDAPGKIADVKYAYHSEVIKLQQSQRKILPLNDRVLVFKSMENRFK